MTLRKLLKKSVDTEPIWVGSHSIKYQISPHTDNSRLISADDDFDLSYRLVSDSAVYRGLKMRLEGADWADTPFGYKEPERLATWDSMIDDITKHGYDFRPLPGCKTDEYISVLIGRDGHILLYNGIHRASCCLLSSVANKIPVRVIYRHPEWVKFRDEIDRYKRRENRIYCQMPHPDLEAIPHLWTNLRADLIADRSFYPGGRVLDIGAHWGTTSHTLARRGFDCTAIERDSSHYTKTERVSRMMITGEGQLFTPLHTDALYFDTHGTFDTLVALNIAHHFLMRENDYTRFMDFLSHNRFKEIFYQSHRPNDKWSTSSVLKLTPRVYLERIMKAAGLSKVEKVKTFNGRDLYHIYGGIEK